MICPNCGAAVSENANFCLKCGHQFDEIRQVEPIRVVIPTTEPEPPKLAQPAAPITPPQIVVREKSATGAIIALTAMLVLLILGVGGLFAYYLLTRSHGAREIAAANQNSSNANIAVAAVPSPTTYEDLKNKLAPPDKRRSLVDEQFDVTTDGARSIEFTIDDPKGARLVGGFRVTKGKAVNFSVYPADADGESLADSYKAPIKLMQTRSKILNQRLKPNTYFAVFESSDESTAQVAAELFLVFD